LTALVGELITAAPDPLEELPPLVMEMMALKLLLREETPLELAEIELMELPDWATPSEAKSPEVLILLVGTV